jgi:hypothetical protein
LVDGHSGKINRFLPKKRVPAGILYKGILVNFAGYLVI